MENWVWYLGLTIISSIIIGVTFWKRWNPRLILFYFFLSTWVLYFEYVIMVIFKSYTYYPNVLGNNYSDNILGAIVSDFFSVPSVAVTIAAFKLKFRWILLLSTAFMGIESLFVMLGLYEHYWWKTIYTGFGLVIYFSASKYLWKYFFQKMQKHYIQILGLYSSYHVLHGLLSFALVSLANLYYFKYGMFTDPIRDHYFLNFPYTTIISLIIAVIIWLKLKWYYRIIGILIIYALDWSLIRIGLLNLSLSFSLIEFFIMHLAITIIIILIKRISIKEHDQLNFDNN